MRRVALLLTITLFTCSLLCFAKKKKTEEELTQVLALPKDPPSAVVADVPRLVFHVSPLSGKGLLSQQTRDALKSLLQQTKGAQIVKLRAFVAGSGDLRRVQTIVSEVLTEKKMNLPALSVVQVGGLPLAGAQVVLESIATDRRVRNEHGLGIVSGQPSTMKDVLGPLKKMTEKAGLSASSVRRVTCFLSDLDNVATLRGQAQAAFPTAALDFVQLQRSTLEDFAECEAVAALSTAPSKAVSFFEPEAGKYSQVAMIGPGKVALTGTQVGYRFQDEDVRLAFGRLGKALESVGGSFKNVAMTHVYPLNRGTADRIRKIRFEFCDPAMPPASTLLLFEGLPGLDAAFAIDVIAVLP